MDRAATRTVMKMRQIKKKASREGLGMTEMDRGRRAGTEATESCIDPRWRREIGYSLRVLIDLENSRSVVAVSACRRWDAAADVFVVIKVCEGRSGEPVA